MHDLSQGPRVHVALMFLYGTKVKMISFFRCYQNKGDKEKEEEGQERSKGRRGKPSVFCTLSYLKLP